MKQEAYYFGVRDGRGHRLYKRTEALLKYDIIGNFPWDDRQLDGGFLDQWRIDDNPDGRIHWIYEKDWFVFCWYDRSGDRRPGSNSGFYVSGYQDNEQIKAFQFASVEFSDIIRRQNFGSRFRLQNLPVNPDLKLEFYR